jgi:acetyltransferase-like isoleucine patch superfamily enzyme
LSGNDTNDVDPSAIIASTARILGQVTLGRGALIHDFVTLYPRVSIGPDVEVFEGAVVGKPPKGTKALARKVSSEAKPTIIDRDCVVSSQAIIYTDVHVGGGTLVGDGALIREQCRIGRQCVIGCGVIVGYNTSVGDFSRIMDGAQIAGNTIIGSHVFVSVSVATSNDSTFGAEGYDARFVRGQVIEDDVCVGAGANILPGVRLGTGSVVGAGAVVTRDVPPKKLVTGIPARIVRDVP